MSKKPAISASKQKRDKLRKFVAELDRMYCEDIPTGVLDGIRELAPEMLDKLDRVEAVAERIENGMVVFSASPFHDALITIAQSCAIAIRKALEDPVVSSSIR